MTNQTEFRVEKIIKKIGERYISGVKVMIIHLTDRLMKNM